MSIHNIIMAAAGNIGGELIGSEQNQSGSSLSLTISKPTGTVSGDIMVAVTATAQPGTNMNQLSGWTRILSSNSDNKLTIQYKVAGGSEPSSYTFTSPSTANNKSGCIATFRYVSYDKIGSANTSSGSGSVSAPSITPTLNNSILLAIYASEEKGTTLVQPSGMTLVATDHPNQGGAEEPPCFAVFYQKNVAASATGSKSCTLENSGQVSGVLMALSPA